MKTIIQTCKRLRYSGPLFIVLALALYTFAQPNATQTPTPTTTNPYSSEQSEAAITIANKLKERHYSGQKLNQQRFTAHLDNYLDTLDGNHLFFLQTDIDSFEPYRNTMGNALQKGDLSPGFVIFDRYQQRLSERLQDTVDHLPESVTAMDFTIDEQIDIDRSEQAWPSDQQAADELWRKMLKNEVLSLRLADKSTDEIITTLTKRYQNQLTRIEQYNTEDVFHVYINALMALYDPHTNYLSPTHSENFAINMSLKLEGIGAMLQSDGEWTKVVRLIHAGPADKQGELKPADRITAVAQGEDGDFEDVIGLRLDEVVQLIRGPKDSIVKLEIIPASDKTNDKRRIISIVRNEVMLEEQSAQKTILAIDNGDGISKIGVITIPVFYMDFDAMRQGDDNYKSTTRDVAQLLNELMEENVAGIVIDLRGNGGGSLQEANALTGLFIDSGATVQIRHANRSVHREGKQYRSNFYDGPLVVLINRLSASASEIFAGAIQDYQRGIVVGTPSFGKGTVQSLMPLKKGQLKITESKFYRISGESTQHRGVTPDIRFPALYDREKVGESTLDNVLPWDTISPLRHPLYFNFAAVLPEIKNKHAQRTENNPDFIFLQEQAQWLEKNNDINTLPLSEKIRRAQQVNDKTDYLTMENKRRKAKGLTPFATIDEFDNENEKTDTDTDNEDDALLIEAAHIVIDSMPAYPTRRYALESSD